MESPFIAKTCINDLDSTSKIIGKIEFVATVENICFRKQSYRRS